MCVCQRVSCDSKLMRCLHIWSAVASERERERTKLHNKFHFELLTFNSNCHHEQATPSPAPLAHSNCSCNLQHSNCNLQLLRIVINFLTVACLVSSRAVNWQIKRIVPASAAAATAVVVGLVKPTGQARQQQQQQIERQPTDNFKLQFKMAKRKLLMQSST